MRRQALQLVGRLARSAEALGARATRPLAIGGIAAVENAAAGCTKVQARALGTTVPSFAAAEQEYKDCVFYPEPEAEVGEAAPAFSLSGAPQVVGLSAGRPHGFEWSGGWSGVEAAWQARRRMQDPALLCHMSRMAAFLWPPDGIVHAGASARPASPPPHSFPQPHQTLPIHALSYNSGGGRRGEDGEPGAVQGQVRHPVLLPQGLHVSKRPPGALRRRWQEWGGARMWPGRWAVPQQCLLHPNSNACLPAFVLSNPTLHCQLCVPH